MSEQGKAVKESGTFYAFREGNKSYILRDVDFTVGDMPKKFWFKWIDMDAKPGDAWVITQFGQDGNTIYDWVEVSYKKELDIDGRKVPVIKFAPTCYSRYTKPEDFTARITLNGFFNIDFWECLVAVLLLLRPMEWYTLRKCMKCLPECCVPK